MTEEVEKKPRLTKGGRNLMFLGIGATLIAVVLTGISLLIYHKSGDIYLDRSRPGFLPDEEELELDEIKVEEYNFERSGSITVEVLEGYIEHLETEMKVIDAFEKPFNPEALSDERLGIPAE